MNVLNDKKIKNKLNTHCYELLKHLIDRGINFSINCNISRVSFEPPLPPKIRDQFPEFTSFILAGYSFDSLDLDDKNLYFEAGFGSEQIGSFVSVPLSAILQILLPNEEQKQDFCVFVNLFATKDEQEDSGVLSSMKALLSNPKNSRFRK